MVDPLTDDPEKTICFCHNVALKTIIEAYKKGAVTHAELQEATHASTGCGGCEGDVLEILESLKAAMPLVTAK